MVGREHSVSSPNGGVQITVAEAGESVRYSVSHRGYVVVSGNLGLELDHSSFLTEVTIDRASQIEGIRHDDKLAHGKRLINRVSANERIIHLANGAGDSLEVVVRAYDDAAAFRYRVPGDAADGQRCITQELTSFDLAHDGLAWMQPTQPAGLHSPAYEALQRMPWSLSMESSSRTSMSRRAW